VPLTSEKKAQEQTSIVLLNPIQHSHIDLVLSGEEGLNQIARSSCVLLVTR
jgi:hypothetical protein